MSFDYLNEAFKKLSFLNEETFDTSLTGLNQLSDFMDQDATDDVVKVIDSEAEVEDDVQDSYIGKVIINCNVCHSHIFENKDDIVIDEDGVVNPEKQCPYCGETAGFVIVGEITPFVEEETEEDATPKVEVNGSDVSVDTATDEPEVDESVETNCDNSMLNEDVDSDNNEDDNVETDFRYYVYSDPDKVVSDGFEFEDDAIEWATENEYPVVKIHRYYRDSDGELNPDGDPEIVWEKGVSLTEAGGTAVLERPREKDLTKIQGTIADVLINHSDKIDACGSNELAVKNCITRILSSDEVRTPEAAQEAIRIINKCRGPKLWSTIGTYMSGLKVASSSKFSRKRLDASLEEDVNNVNVETDDSVVNIHAEEGGKVTVSTEPKVQEETGEESISPLSDETIADIESANGLSDTPSEGDEEDVDIEEVDETALDELGESYLKGVYENVESFRTSNVLTDDKHLVVEGVIKFKSGAEKKTGFIFEAHSATPDGKVRFIGKNEHFSRGSKAFTLTGRITDKKLISESFTYNYRAKTADGKSNRIYGTVKK